MAYASIKLNLPTLSAPKTSTIFNLYNKFITYYK